DDGPASRATPVADGDASSPFDLPTAVITTPNPDTEATTVLPTPATSGSAAHDTTPKETPAGQPAGAAGAPRSDDGLADPEATAVIRPQGAASRSLSDDNPATPATKRPFDDDDPSERTQVIPPR